MKGIELGTVMRMSQVIAEVTGFPGVPGGRGIRPEPRPVRSPSGSPPRRLWRAPTRLAQALAEATTTAYFRPYYTTDVAGTELGGAVKNVIALANGMAYGLGFGENAQAPDHAGLAEMSPPRVPHWRQSTDVPGSGRHR